MPNKKTNTYRLAKTGPKAASLISEEIKPLAEKTETPVPKKRNLFLPATVLFLLVIVGLGYFFKDKFIAATINGKPVFRYELNKRLSSVFGKETLENLIVEKLIQKEAKSKGVTVSDKDISEEITKMEKNLSAGMRLEDALKFQGVTMAEFKRQLELRLQVNRILEKEISITPEEIDKYVKDNVKVLVATTEAERKVEAQERLKEQKISERVQAWVSELLSKAKITRFLK